MSYVIGFAQMKIERIMIDFSLVYANFNSLRQCDIKSETLNPQRNQFSTWLRYYLKNRTSELR